MPVNADGIVVNTAENNGVMDGNDDIRIIGGGGAYANYIVVPLCPGIAVGGITLFGSSGSGDNKLVRIRPYPRQMVLGWRSPDIHGKTTSPDPPQKLKSS